MSSQGLAALIQSQIYNPITWLNVKSPFERGEPKIAIVWTLDFSFPSFLISNSSNFVDHFPLPLLKQWEMTFFGGCPGFATFECRLICHELFASWGVDPRKTRPSFNDGNPPKKYNGHINPLYTVDDHPYHWNFTLDPRNMHQSTGRFVSVTFFSGFFVLFLASARVWP